ncbi:MAG TPA: hypothetical protein PKC60_13695 [Hydrogenophaga sp.]|mgnify:CR=1 FL=1|uniref:COG1470 family protein n=1 Tax=Hydrogenophaga sp. TaxID=1904254 RepID=UPI002C29F53D|nr:hypothetical protein [Hydrogenophaga sp.]HMN94279.1 hypothetical protein [Hydrogenophaga sp.]HMP11009.1 hypothetical protein [Hydrogenophaga sp.]
MPLVRLPHGCRLWLAVALAAGPVHALAQGFAAYVTPPRIEAKVQPGQTIRQVIEIQHAGRSRGNYRFYTNDWSFNPDRSVQFQDALAPDSCRPWVAIERRELSLESGSRYRYRIEISPPAGTAPRECRFALMIEGMDPALVESGVSIPVSGRIGVIVYVAVGDVRPQLVLENVQVQRTGDRPQIELTVRNEGLAHGRLEGFVTGRDADGRRTEFSPADSPILPGETRPIALIPLAEEGQPATEWRLPLRIQGRLEWAGGQLPIDLSLAP